MNKQTIELSMQLFGAVPAGPERSVEHSSTLPHGFVVDGAAAYAQKAILAYWKAQVLSGEQLNATFHKSWQVIRDSSREELWMHQILHYLTTYGTHFESDYVYFPAEKLELPAVTKLGIQVIKGLSADTLIKKCLKMLSSGMALDEKTIDALLLLLSNLGYTFETVDHVRNKEALVKIIAQTGLYPSQPAEFLRYLLFLATESTLLIKNKETIEAIRAKKLNVAKHLEDFGLARCAEVFLRFKPLWLAFKSHKANVSRINEISRLARRHHRPLPVDILNAVTSTVYSADEIQAALGKANVFRKIRLLNALKTRLNRPEAFLYRVRNGKSFSVPADHANEAKTRDFLAYYRRVYDQVYADFLSGLTLQGKRIRYPDNVDYGLPSTEKMFVGNFPAGTRITARKLVSGVYWENKWGANDLDLSALSLAGKVGWNSAYKGQGLLYSGDITDAPQGATELLYTSGALDQPALAINSIFSGKVGCKIKLVVGEASDVSENYMFDPNELILEAETNMVRREQILGLFLPEEDQRVTFVLVNAGFGSMAVSSRSTQSDNARNALFYQFSSPISMKKVLEDAGAILVTDGEADINLMPKELQKDTFIDLLTGK